MKIKSTSSVSGTVPVRRKQASTLAAPETDSARAIADTVSILGIPAEEMTPKVRSAIMTLMSEVETLRREVEAAERRLLELETLADQDPLVPVSNRRAFVRELSRMISFADRYGVPSSLVFFDVNGMKQTNDTLGHAAGDAILIHVAQTLSANVRESDIVGRLGGDEFGVILAQADEEQGQSKADKLADLITSNPVWVGDRAIRAEVAYGVYSFRSAEDAGEALARADKRMYEHKRAQRGESAD